MRIVWRKVYKEGWVRVVWRKVYEVGMGEGSVK